MPAETSDYQKAHATYRELAKAAANGDAKAKAEKVAVMNDIRKIEREAARAGTVLSAVYSGNNIKVQQHEAPSKRSLQEEYIRKFDPEKTVSIDGKEQTLREFHTKRLLGKK